MKTTKHPVNRGLLFLAAILAVIVTLSSCQKNVDNNYNNTPVAGLMAFNLAPGQDRIGFSIGGNNLNAQPLAFSNYTGAYLNIFPGQRTIESRNLNSGNLLDTTQGNFVAGKYYSVFLVGRDSLLSNVLVHDDIDSLTAEQGQAYIRYINAIPDQASPNVSIAAGGSNLFNGTAAFKTVSEFKQVAPGSVAVTVNNEGNSNASRSFDVEARKLYTVLLMGNPDAAPGSADSVQIRYIVNGQIAQ